jgi:hypothetical protein
MLKRIFALCLFSVFLLSLSVYALYVKTGDNVYITPDMIINDNLFVAGETVKVAGTVKGDLIAFGGEVTLQGVVDGDIIVAGGDVLITGSARNMFVAGGDVAINGVIKHDLIAGCGDLYIGKETRVGKDAFLGCGDARIAGKIYRDLKAGVGSLILLPTALVKGKLDYSADNANFSDKARIVGKVKAYDRPDYGARYTGFVQKFALTQQVLSFLSIFIVGILIIVFLPKQVEMVTEYMTAKFWQSLGWGILTLIVVPIVMVLLLITVIGIPLGILLSIAYFFALYIHGIFSGVVIGKWILAKFRGGSLPLAWPLLLGLILIHLVDLIPVVGWVVKFVLVLWSFGAIAATRLPTYEKARQGDVI